MSLHLFTINDVCLVSGSSEVFHWKNYLATHLERLIESIDKIDLDDENILSNILMAERDIVCCSFMMRIMLEKKLITDRLSHKEFKISYWRTKEAEMTLKMPMKMAGGYYGYDFSSVNRKHIKYSNILNYIIHSQNLAFVVDKLSKSKIAFNSDYSRSDCLYIISKEEFTSIAREFLDDIVSIASDRIDHATQKVISERR